MDNLDTIPTWKIIFILTSFQDLYYMEKIILVESWLSSKEGIPATYTVVRGRHDGGRDFDTVYWQDDTYTRKELSLVAHGWKEKSKDLEQRMGCLILDYFGSIYAFRNPDDKKEIY